MRSRIDNFSELNANNIFVFDDFLSAAQCNEILFAIDNNSWEDSKVVSRDENLTYRTEVSNARTSQSIFEFFFPHSLKKLTGEVQDRLVEKTNIDPCKLESWQISKYSYGEQFEYHIDGGFLEDDPAGERDKTIIVYLMSPLKGGETYFKALHLYVRPVQGRLIIWDNLLPDGNCNWAMMHAGMPVKKGIKVIMNTWMRQNFTIKL